MLDESTFETVVHLPSAMWVFSIMWKIEQGWCQKQICKDMNLVHQAFFCKQYQHDRRVYDTRYSHMRHYQSRTWYLPPPTCASSDSASSKVYSLPWRSPPPFLARPHGQHLVKRLCYLQTKRDTPCHVWSVQDDLWVPSSTFCWHRSTVLGGFFPWESLYTAVYAP